MDLDQELNPQQKEAVLHEGGSLFVLAGAGSGKTRALTYRIAHLILHRNVPPWRILAITFTNKAAEEMRLRVQQLLGTAQEGIWMGTFHATCARILRQHIERLGYRRNFVIYDDEDQLRVIRSTLRALPEGRTQIRPLVVQSLLERAKNQGMDPVHLVLQHSSSRRELEEVLSDYRQRMQEANALDFGDLIVFVLRLFDEHPDVRRIYQDRFRSILVDEYQDTNRAQHLLLQKLASDGCDLCVVGDDDQSIYRWRGAEVNNLLHFEKDFPGTRMLAFEENYRSTQTILRAADAVAQGNPERREKRLWTSNEAGDRLVYMEAPTADQEAAFVASEIQRLVEGKRALYRNIGVFFRTNSQSRPFEEKFLLFGIPHAVIGLVRFYQRAEVKDLLAYLRFLYNPADSVSLLRILNQPPRGIGAATQAALQAYAAQHGGSLWETIEQASQHQGLSGVFVRRLGGFLDLIQQLRRTLESDTSLEGFLRTLVEQIGYNAFLEGREDGERRMENVEEFVRTAGQFSAAETASHGDALLGAFLQRVALVSDTDQYQERADCVSLMTLHCAKGLEFPIVFLTGLEDGVLPHERSYTSPEALAEERRLCYVGMTRAIKRLYLSRACFRANYEGMQRTEPSPFLASIPPELVEFHERERLSEYAKGDRSTGQETRESVLEYEESQLDTPPSLRQRPASRRVQRFHVGDRLEHESLGIGIVRRVEGSGHKEKVTVQFGAGGVRKLMVQMSPVRKLP